jgi:hypothetical protein
MWGRAPHRGLPRWGTFAERGKARSGKTPVRPWPVQGAIPATVGIALENPSPRARRPSPMFQHRGKARAPQKETGPADPLNPAIHALFPSV